jgi:hypothetical protein
MARRRPPPDIGGSSASFMAIPAWNGLVGPNALPTMAAPQLMATTTTALTPRPRPRRSSTGTSGMISSCMFSTAPMSAKKNETIGMAQRPRPWKRATIAAISRASVPSLSRTTHAPPTKSTTATTSAASTNPRGTATKAANGPTGAGSTPW